MDLPGVGATENPRTRRSPGFYSCIRLRLLLKNGDVSPMRLASVLLVANDLHVYRVARCDLTTAQQAMKVAAGYEILAPTLGVPYAHLYRAVPVHYDSALQDDNDAGFAGGCRKAERQQDGEQARRNETLDSDQLAHVLPFLNCQFHTIRGASRIAFGQMHLQRHKSSAAETSVTYRGGLQKFKEDLTESGIGKETVGCARLETDCVATTGRSVADCSRALQHRDHLAKRNF